jgi:hypothetical protein
MKTTKELQDEIWKSIHQMEILMKDNPNGWVVESENHINVGQGYGLNGTCFNVKCASTCANPVIWDNELDAMKYGFNQHLIDGKGDSIELQATKTVEFFTREIKKAKEISNLIDNYLKQ